MSKVVRVMYCEMLFIIISINLVKLHLCSTVVTHTVNERSVLRRMVMEFLYSNYTLVLLGTVVRNRVCNNLLLK